MALLLFGAPVLLFLQKHAMMVHGNEVLPEP